VPSLSTEVQRGKRFELNAPTCLLYTGLIKGCCTTVTVTHDPTDRHRLQYDSPDEQAARQEATNAVLLAARKIRPRAFSELRDLPRHELEGWDVIEAELAERFSRTSGSRELGQLHVLGRLWSPQAEQPDSEPDESMRQPVFFSDGFETLREPTLVVFVPVTVSAWAIKWRLSTPQFETTLVLLRHQWRRRPAAARKCQMLFSSLPTVLKGSFVRVPSDQQWEALSLRAAGPAPMLETKHQFLQRAAANYDKRVAEYYQSRTAGDEGGSADGHPRFVPRKKYRSLSQHAGWLARVQVAGESPKALAKEEGASPRAVDLAVRRLATFIGLALRPLPKSGRPLGRRDVVPGGRPSRKK
jgi:hypothetical protein